jgi:hypothetical protein
MSEGARLVRAWRERRKAKGLKSILIWLRPAEKRLLEMQAAQYGEDFGRVVARLLRQSQAPTPVVHTETKPLSGPTKLTPLQVAEMRGKRAAGVPIKALLEEYAVSRATAHRYLKAETRTSGRGSPSQDA